VVSGSIERASITDPDRTWQGCVADSLMAEGDAELLARAIDNLLANVTAHTPVGTAAAVTTAKRGSAITIEVSDDGPGVPDHQLPRIFDRFYRAGASAERPGSGLGLAIVTAITTPHNGTAEATRNYPSGLRVTLTLPAAVRPDNPEHGAPDAVSRTCQDLARSARSGSAN